MLEMKWWKMLNIYNYNLSSHFKFFNVFLRLHFAHFPLKKFFKNIRLLKKSCLKLKNKQLFFSNPMFLKNFSKGNLSKLEALIYSWVCYPPSSMVSRSLPYKILNRFSYSIASSRILNFSTLSFSAKLD